MWAYKAWQGLHFPDHLARREQLGVYASWCSAVEGNTTFYGLPAPRTVASWANEAPTGFRFVFKLPRAITHEHHLHDVAADHREFLERIAPLGDRAEQLSIQLPPSFGPADVDALAAFVESLPRSHRYAVELRHHAFYDDPQLEAHVEQLLGEHGVEWISLDTTTLYADVTPSAAERGARRQTAPAPPTPGPHRPSRRALRRHRRPRPDPCRLAAVAARARRMARRGPLPHRVRPHPRQRRRTTTHPTVVRRRP